MAAKEGGRERSIFNLDLLKTLEGYVVNSVEIEYTRYLGSKVQADIEISAYEHGNLKHKTVSFRIMEAS
ncbi:hypothetical protein LCGC14_1517090 [marine sediment metagenome]|uniref:Uncharacterized protein n=1 Tax=marine sediment metagenome TaxID=412755 RepID=A0A0F9LFF7_9ZZZZ